MRKSNKKKLFGLLIFAVLVIIILLISFQGQEEGNVKVGAMLVLSGEGASWGEVSQRAINLAVSEVNENGGINGRNIEVVYEDTEGNVGKAISAYNKLTDIDKVVAIIGPNMQAEMTAVAPLANEDKFPIIAPSYAPLDNRPNKKNPLMIWLDPTIEAEEMAEYVYNEGIRSVSVLGTLDSWEKEVSNAFANKFGELGGEVYFIDLVQISEDEVKTSSARAIEKNPDAIYLGTYYQFLNFGRTLKELGYGGKVYSIEVDEYLAGESKEFTNGLEFISSDSYKDEFREKYETTYGEKSNIPSGQSYDAANILISFLKQTTDREEIVELMENFESYSGVSGEIRIDEEGRTLIPTAIYRIENGEIVKVIGSD